MTEILILYYSRHGATKKLAQAIARGVEMVEGAQAKLRTVAEISNVCEQTEPKIPEQGCIYASEQDLQQCDGLIIGSPSHFGNMAAPLKYFIDQSSSTWMSGGLNGKPGAVFTSSSSLHGGQESTLFAMMTPLLHHGMMIVGIPYSETELLHTTTGGSPYGSTHFAGDNNSQQLSDSEIKLANALGKRVAVTAQKLKK